MYGLRGGWTEESQFRCFQWGYHRQRTVPTCFANRLFLYHEISTPASYSDIALEVAERVKITFAQGCKTTENPFAIRVDLTASTMFLYLSGIHGLGAGRPGRRTL